MSTYDVIVVGTSFSSSFFLKKLRERYPEKRILVLEKGNFVAHKTQVEKVSAKQIDSTSSSSSRHLIQDNRDNHHFVYNVSFGGGSNCWVGCTPRLMPSDFTLKSTYGVGKDWPISYEDLAPYYSEAESIMNISGSANNPYPKPTSYPLPPHKLLPFDKLLAEKYPGLVHAQATARASQALPDRAKCCGSSVCSLCPIDAKFTIQNGLKQVYEKLDLEYGAEVFALELKNNLAQKVYYRVGKVEKEASADLFVLGANPIFNSHILLNSGDNHPLLGSGIGEQRSVMVRINLDMDNAGGSSINSANMWMLYEGEFRKDSAACLIESQNAVDMIRLEKGKLRHLALFKCIFEDLYQPENSVTTTDDLFLPKITYKGPSSYLEKGVSELPNKLENMFASLPVEKYSISEGLTPTEAHIIGGHIMGQNIEDSVVDALQIHHRYRNVMLLGAGSFSSMGAANPSLTISALSLRSADLLEL